MKRLSEWAWSIYGRFAWDKHRNHQLADMICEIVVNTLTKNKKNSLETVLDAGCGTGFYASRIAGSGFVVTGIDYADGMLMQAKKKYKSNVNLLFKKMDISRRISYQDCSFNHAILISSLQAVPDPVSTLKEIYRVVKPQGCVIITHACKPESYLLKFERQVTPNFNNPLKKNWLSRALFYLKFYVERKGFSTCWTLPELISMIEACQLTILKIDCIGSMILITTRK